ncbi:shikimate dehydrogenase [Chiayiivirga flava]|uniref:Shikimate dehydrogenase (NADP(+)) n=1 Tax=Chiayiivirga flava TaxID=659595 RepID=A0A7W8FYH8_9GAMM|nr:shikimate dehydrogenase [Chiayiivirga flava]MBB5207412.1 shikimate dehydrogenase [Chiayiivirga flava]
MQQAHSLSGTPRYAVFGQPIAHSQSPAIHRHFADQFGIVLRYDAIEAAPAQFADVLAQFAHGGGIGANVTLPLKELAASLCAELGDAARIAGTVNTLTRLGDGWRGDNTDGDGLVRDITDHLGQDLRGRRTLLLGAGGAARGVAPALLDAGIDELVIANRTPERADALADRIGQPDRAHSRYWADLAHAGAFDLIVNATSAGRGSAALALPSSLLGARCLCYDLSYGEAATGFLAWARSGGALQAVDGLGMLIEQAASAFERWHGQRPDTAPVHAALRARAAALHTAD